MEPLQTATPDAFDIFGHASGQTGGDTSSSPETVSVTGVTKSARSRCGRKRFGFYEGEKAIIVRMVELREKGIGFDRIAENLNREAVPTRSGKAWHGRVVNRILKTELGISA